MKEKLNDTKRKELFDYYNVLTNPFIIINTKIDITNIYNKCENHYAAIGYFITLAANKIDNFKYRYENDDIYKYDTISPSYADTFDDKTLGFFTCDLKDNYRDFRDEYLKVKDKFLKTHQSIKKDIGEEYWFSCTPWFNTTCLIPPFDKSITTPQFSWDKFIIENGHCYVNLMIMAHHGLVDGYHIHLFLENLEDIINNIEKYL